MRRPSTLIATVSLLSVLTASAVAGEVTLTVTEPSGLTRENWPVTSGIPFPEGVLKPGEPVGLVDSEGKPVPLQTTVLATWRDGCVKGLLLDFQTTVSPRQTKRYVVKYGEDAGRAVQGGPLAKDLDDRIEIDAGPLKAVIRRASWKKKGAPKAGQTYAEPYRLLESLELNGQEVLADERAPTFVVKDSRGKPYVSQLTAPVTAEIEYNGSERTCIKATGVMTSVPPGGVEAPRFKWIARLNFYRGRPTVGISFAIQRTGNMLWRNEGFRQQETDDMLPIESMSMEMKLRPGFLGKAAEPLANRDTFKIISSGSLQAALRTFSQQPSVLEVTKDGTLRISSWKHTSNDPLEVKKDEFDKDARLAIGQGFRLGAKVFLHFDKRGVRTDMKPFRKRLLALATPEWYADSRVFSEFLPHDLRQFPNFTHIEKETLDKVYPDGKALHVLPLPRCPRHGNIVAYGAYLRFFATGKRAYFDIADRRTLSERELPFYVYLPVYDDDDDFAVYAPRWSVKFLSAGKISSKWPTADGKTLRGGGGGCFFVCSLISLTPMMEEYLWHYLLTGERASLELARGRADDLDLSQYMMEPSLRGEDNHNHWRRVYGKAAIHVQQYYEFTRDRGVYNDLKWVWGEFAQKPMPGGIYPLIPVLEPNGASEHGFVLMSMLGKSLYETFGDSEAMEILVVRGTDYLRDWYWDRKRGVFMSGGVGRHARHDVGRAALLVCQCMAMAYDYTGDPSYMEIAERAYTNLTKDGPDKNSKPYRDALAHHEWSPTTSIPFLTRFHYYLDQYRTHRGRKCPSEYVALSAAKIKGLLNAEKCAEKRIRLCQALAAKAGPGDAATLAKVATDDPDEQVARNAATALGNVHTDEAVTLLKGLSRTAKRMPVRLASLHSLVRNRKAARLSEQFTALLSDRERLVRITAARLLVATDKIAAVTTLTEALKTEKSPFVKKEMLQLLGTTRDRKVIGTLLGTLNDTEADPVVRGGAALGLGELGADDEEILQALIARGEGFPRNQALLALVRIGTERAADAVATSPLLGKRWNYYHSGTSLGALMEFPGPRASRRLTELAKREYGGFTKRMQPRLVRALSRRTDAAATEGLKDIAKNHKDKEIRSLSAALLQKR